MPLSKALHGILPVCFVCICVCVPARLAADSYATVPCPRYSSASTPPCFHSQRALAGHWVCYIYLRQDCGWTDGWQGDSLFISVQYYVKRVQIAIVVKGFSLSALISELWYNAWHCNSVVSAQRLLSRWDNLFTPQCQSGPHPGSCISWTLSLLPPLHIYLHGSSVLLLLALPITIPLFTSYRLKDRFPQITKKKPQIVLSLTSCGVQACWYFWFYFLYHSVEILSHKLSPAFKTSL